MEEKRKLEKLMFADIDGTSAIYRSARRTEREKVERECVAKAHPDIHALYDLFKSAKKEEGRIERELAKVGYRVSCYRDEYTLEVAYGDPKPKPIRDHDAETARTEKALADLKRSYTLKLFAGGEEAKELFASLAHELASIIG